MKILLREKIILKMQYLLKTTSLDMTPQSVAKHLILNSGYIEKYSDAQMPYCKYYINNLKLKVMGFKEQYTQLKEQESLEIQTPL